jgi:hypothetical protein
VRGALEERAVEADVGRAFHRLDGLHRQPLELEDVGQREREIERILSAGDARIVAAQVPVHVRLLLGQLLVKPLAEVLHGDHEEDRAASQRAHVVAQDLALPPRVQDILPALGLLTGLHHVGVDEDAVGDHVDRHPGAVRLERRHRARRVRERAVGLERALGQLQRGGGGPVVRDVAEHLAGGLLGTDALAQLAGSRLQELEADAVLGLEGGAGFRQSRGTDRAVVDDDLAFLLRGLDQLLPLRVGGRLGQGRAGGGDRGDGGETKQGSAGQHRFSPWGRSVTTARDGFAPVVVRRNGTGTRGRA